MAAAQAAAILAPTPSPQTSSSPSAGAPDPSTWGRPREARPTKRLSRLSIGRRYQVAPGESYTTDHLEKELQRLLEASDLTLDEIQPVPLMMDVDKNFGLSQCESHGGGYDKMKSCACVPIVRTRAVARQALLGRGPLREETRKHACTLTLSLIHI